MENKFNIFKSKYANRAKHKSDDFCCLKIENLCVNFGKVKVLNNINLHIHCGELTTIMGPNGAGKTSLFRALINDTPFTGKIKYTDASDESVGHPIIGYVPQKLHINQNTPANVIDLFSSCLSNIPIWCFNTKKIKNLSYDLLSRVKAEHLMNRKLCSLSGGELQRVLLAISLYPLPNVLLLDEPVSGVDNDGLKLFYNIVSELRHSLDLSIILITHDLTLVEKYSDRIIILNNKEIKFSGSCEELKNETTFKNELNSQDLFVLELRKQLLFKDYSQQYDAKNK